MTKSTTKFCDSCEHFNMFKETCDKGHKLRFYNPKHANDSDWGWKRKCGDFVELEIEPHERKN